MGYHVRVKVCGVTSVADARHAIAAGAEALGLNFHPPSPRFLDAEAALAILRAVPAFVDVVGVFVDVPVRDAREHLASLGRVTTIQMHGTRREVADPFPYRLVPAFAVRGPEDLLEVQRYLEACRVAGHLPQGVLVDGHAAGLFGGTGQKAPWDLLAEFSREVPLILAGGLTPDNVAEAVTRVRPFAVDVASGVESAPGRKDPDKVSRFIAAAREAAARL